MSFFQEPLFGHRTHMRQAILKKCNLWCPGPLQGHSELFNIKMSDFKMRDF